MKPERLLSHADFARARHTTPRQVRRWLAAGLPTRAGKIPARAAAAWLRARAKDRNAASDETAALLLAHAQELQQRVERLVAAHVPAHLVAEQWEDLARWMAAVFSGWPAEVAPKLMARLSGDLAAAPILDPRITARSRDLLEGAPASRLAMSMACAEQARMLLERLADTPPEPDTKRARVLEAAQQRWVESPPMSTPRTTLGHVRARLRGFQRAIASGEWEPAAVVERRWSGAVVVTRQALLEQAPGLMAALPQDATAAQIEHALEQAVSGALYVLRLGVRPGAAVPVVATGYRATNGHVTPRRAGRARARRTIPPRTSGETERTA